MKTRTLPAFFFTAALAAFASIPAFASPPEKPAFTHPVSAIDQLGQTIVRGSVMSDVLRILGMPEHKLTADVWIYSGYNGGQAQRRDDDCSILLLTFTRGRISDIQLANTRAVKTYAARLRAPAPRDGQIAAR